MQAMTVFQMGQSISNLQFQISNLKSGPTLGLPTAQRAAIIVRL
jgi:hypothetical protein